MKTDARIYVAGHEGMVGSAICRRLLQKGYRSVITAPRKALDLLDFISCREFFERERPEYVFLAAARVGGILANSTRPADFILDNLKIQTNVIELAFRSGVRKLMFLGSSCIYPRMAAQPIRESSLLAGPLEPTNEPYAVAKIAGIKLCQALRKQYGFNAISIMPTNLYGPGDNFSLDHGHVLPGLMRRFHEAKLEGLCEVEVWGTGEPRREFLHVDDLADCAHFLMMHYSDAEIVNAGVGMDLTIAEAAEMVKEIVGLQAELRFCESKPDGTPRKRLNVDKLAALGWKSKIALREGLATTYAWFLEHQADLRT